jgi:hypothetical protein
MGPGLRTIILARLHQQLGHQRMGTGANQQRDLLDRAAREAEVFDGEIGRFGDLGGRVHQRAVEVEADQAVTRAH